MKCLEHRVLPNGSCDHWVILRQNQKELAHTERVGVCGPLRRPRSLAPAALRS